MRGGVVARPFKCLTSENAEAWALIVERFFGGVDRLPACST